jgi:hypothetical protein
MVIPKHSKRDLIAHDAEGQSKALYIVLIQRQLDGMFKGNGVRAIRPLCDAGFVIAGNEIIE